MPFSRSLLIAMATTALVACGGDSNGATVNASDGSGPAREGVVERKAIPSPVDGEIVFQLFEPEEVVPGERYPLVLHSHGYGGSRQTEPTGLIGELIARGYYVISIDQRGFGESTGPVRVMDPDAEGRDLVAILDWAEENLEQVARDGDGTMMVGSYGSSYGGGYQLLLQAVDPQHRLRALVPDITWHDLSYSLNPGDTVKSGWALLLSVAGESGSQLGQDNIIRETLIQGTLTNNFPEGARDWFRYHSPRYFCDGEPLGPFEFLQGTETPQTPPTVPPAADVMIWQGFPDTLFNVTEAFDNFRCLRERGGDVRLLTHQSGHILPLGPAALSEDLDTALDQLAPLVTVPEFQGPAGANACGGIDRATATLAWFEAKLKGKTAALDAVVPTGKDICLSLEDEDAIAVSEVPIGGEDFPVVAETPQLSGVLGTVGSLLGSELPGGIAGIPLTTIGEDGGVLAGQPTFHLEVEPVLPGLAMEDCAVEPLPLACDPILYLGLGVQRDGSWQLIDDQLQPLRGFGSHGTPQEPARLVAVAERLQPGDTLGLMVFGFHPQYPISFSRDVLVPAVNLRGRVQVPLLSEGEITAEGF
jgi:ABC-2 type transport system ATP-binding protein